LCELGNIINEGDENGQLDFGNDLQSWYKKL
jgi:hypothetical protein